MTKYSKMTEMPLSDVIGTVWTTSSMHDVAFFDKFMFKSILFVRGFPISVEKIDRDDRGDSDLSFIRQNLLRDQGTLQKLLIILQELIPISESTDITVPNRRNPKTEEFESLLKMGQKVLNLSFELLYFSIKDNPANQMYVADFMPVLLAHLGGQDFASKLKTKLPLIK